ncbi:MAG: hypothetical protein ACYC5M_08235 [Anaerolineae bacterium]
MQNRVNQSFLTKRGKIARWGTYIGIGALVIGLMTTTRSILISYAFMLVGLIGASIGSYMTSRYVREPRADQIITTALEGLDKRFAGYHYLLGTNHVIASHYGLTVVIPKAQDGLITFQNGRFRHKAGFRRVFQFFGEQGLGKPDQELAQEVGWVKEWIDQVMPEPSIPVNGVVVFTSPKAELQIRGANVPAVAVDQLADYMRTGLKGSTTLTTATQKDLRRLLDQVEEN